MGGIFVYKYLTSLLFLPIFATNKLIMEEIIQKICEEFNISRDDFFNIKYVRFYVAVRSVTMIILKEKGFKTSTDISNLFGYRYTNTAKYIANAREWIKTDRLYFDIYNKIKAAIG